ncbi:MAG: nucleotidyltransferase family protein [Eubacterium sp.]
MSRALLHIILDIKTEDVEKFIDDNYMKYGRLLAFNNRSSILSSIKENSSIEIVSKFSTYYNQAQGLTKKMLDIDLKADNLYRMIYMTKYNKSIPGEFKRQIYIL